MNQRNYLELISDVNLNYRSDVDFMTPLLVLLVEFKALVQERWQLGLLSHSLVMYLQIGILMKELQLTLFLSHFNPPHPY